jgi:ligand-binding sensor domain-containing protein
MQGGYFVGAPWSITQSKDEYVWIATEAGPVRFDGAICALDSA